MDIIDIKRDLRSIGPYQHISDDRQRWRGGVHLPRHKHAERFASIVLSGGFEECGSRGRIFAAPGDVLIHGAFDIHLNRVFVSGTEVLNLRLPGLGAIEHAFGRISNPDDVAKLAETDPAAAAGMLCEQTVPEQIIPRDWIDLLALELIEEPNYNLAEWARTHHLAAATLSRGFGRVFGLSPRAFRSEIRTRRAFEQIVQGTEVLAKVLERSGFYDYAHMSRSVRTLTGAAPNTWLAGRAFTSSSKP